jgi:hypothetical protein
MRELCRGDTAKIASGQRRRRCEGEKQKRDHARGEQKQSSGEWQWAKQSNGTTPAAAVACSSVREQRERNLGAGEAT